ncbi:MAG: hypothetical protein ACLQLH_10630 [Terracidiphilus sp.]
MKNVQVSSKFITYLGAVLAVGLGLAASQEAPKPANAAATQTPIRNAASKAAHIVNDQLMETPDGFHYRVIGKVYNSSDEALVNVSIVYNIWKKYYPNGSLVKGTDGQVSAHIKYLPPKQMVDFVAAGNAPVITSSEPEPIQAEIAAQFAEE